MDEKRELNDILIGGEDDKAKQSKKLILLIVGIVVLALACVVIVVSMTGNKEEPIVIGEQTSVDGAMPDTLGVDITSDDDKFEQIVQEIKKKQQGQEIQQAPVPETPLARAEEPRATMPERRVTPQPQQRPVVVQQQAPRAATYRGNNGDIAESGYYLQVGAFSKTPNRAFMDNINRYSYRVQEVMINSKVITRYLVGPYPSREAAQRDYASVARDITTPVHFQID